MKKTKRILTGILLAGVIAVGYAWNNQCAFIKSDGTQCRGKAQAGSSYCWSHNR